MSVKTGNPEQKPKPESKLPVNDSSSRPELKINKANGCIH